MKRPLAVVGLTLFFVMLALSFLSASRAAVAAGAVFFALLLGSVLHPRLRRSGFWPTLLFSGLLGCLLFLLFCTLQRQPALSFAGTRDVMTCEATSYPTPNSTGTSACHVPIGFGTSLRIIRIYRNPRSAN